MIGSLGLALAIGGMAVAAVVAALLQGRSGRSENASMAEAGAGSFELSFSDNSAGRSAPADVNVAAILTREAIGTPVSTIALDTALIGINPDDHHLAEYVTELVDVTRPAEMADLFGHDPVHAEGDDADPYLVATRRAVIRAYRSSGRGACLVVPVSGQPGVFLDLRIERYSPALATVCSEMFLLLTDVLDWQESGEGSMPESYAGLAKSAPALLRSLRTSIRDLKLPPSYDYIRGEIDAYAQALSGRLTPLMVMDVIDRFGRIEHDAAERAATAEAPARLLCLMAVIAVWDAVILNFGFHTEIED